MGRPLKSVFFGNRGGGTNPGVGGYRITALYSEGSGSGYTTIPTITGLTPQLPGGVAITYAVHMEANAATIVGAGGGDVTTNDYAVDDVLEVNLGGGQTAQFTVTSVDVAGGVTGVAIVNASRGDVTTLPTNPLDTTQVSGTGTGTGCQLNLTYRVKNVVVTNPTANQGYVLQDFNPAFSAGNATIDDIDDVQVQGDAGTILARAYIGGNRVDVDIIKQHSSRRYKVKAYSGSPNPVFARLVAHESDAAGEMDLTAYDASSNEYWVVKLEERNALVIRKNPAVGLFAHPADYPNGQLVPWGNAARAVQYPNYIELNGVGLETT